MSLFNQIDFQFVLSLSFWNPSDANVGTLEVVPDASYTVLIFFEFFLLLAILIGCFFFLLFQIADLILEFIYTTTDSL